MQGLSCPLTTPISEVGKDKERFLEIGRGSLKWCKGALLGQAKNEGFNETSQRLHMGSLPWETWETGVWFMPE